MSTVSDAIRGIQKILTLQVRIDQLEASNRKIAADNDAMAHALHDLAHGLAAATATAAPAQGLTPPPPAA